MSSASSGLRPSYHIERTRSGFLMTHSTALHETFGHRGARRLGGHIPWKTSTPSWARNFMGKCFSVAADSSS
jgi:hypothetical protein